MKHVLTMLQRPAAGVAVCMLMFSLSGCAETTKIEDKNSTPRPRATTGAAPETVIEQNPTPNNARTLSQEDAGFYLRASARDGDLELVEGLVRAGAPIDAVDHKGYSPLILASYHGHLNVVNILLELGADPCQGDKRGNTAMMGAAFKGHQEIVARLSEAPCGVDQTNGQGRTALMFASLVGRSGVVSMLENMGADPKKTDLAGRSAEDWAQTQVLPKMP